MIKSISMFIIFATIFVSNSFSQNKKGNESLQMQLATLESKIEVIQSQNEAHLDKIGGALFLIFMGIVAGLWAKSTGRNPWLWLMAGVVFSIFTAIAMLLKNNYDSALKKHKEKLKS